MTNISRCNDCGNSPKNQLLEDFEIAMVTIDFTFLQQVMTPHIQGYFVGQTSVKGANEFLKALPDYFQHNKVTELAIHHVMSHGKVGAVNGLRQHQDGKICEFCTVYEFGTAKGTAVKSLTHYAIESVPS